MENNQNGSTMPRFVSITAKMVVRLGQIVATSRALEHIPNVQIVASLARHQAGDWGDVGEGDWQANDRALESGARLFSVYHSARGVKFWIITEADRSVTTILLPVDYGSRNKKGSK